MASYPSSNNLDHHREGNFFGKWRLQPLQGDPTGVSESTLMGWLYPSAWERDFVVDNILVWTRENYMLPWILSFMYVAFVFLGPKVMAKRNPFGLKNGLMAWNLFLAVFSFMGAMRTVPHILALLFQEGWQPLLCQTAIYSFGRGACGLWTILFIHSKYWEFIDTAFLVLRKRPVSFLHWYHHFTVLLYCWHSLMYETPSGIVFVSMNYTVHAIMYFYYFLMARGIRCWWAKYITYLQISQMVVGMFTVASSAYYRYTVPNCDGSERNLIFGMIIYGSYFMLFCQFFIGKYLEGKKKPDAKQLRPRLSSNPLKTSVDLHSPDSAKNLQELKKKA